MGHGNISKKLKDYTQEELLELAILALSSNNPILLRCFVGKLPTIEELRLNKAEVEEETILQQPPPTPAKPLI